MMRSDGTATFYVVEFKTRARDEWSPVNVAVILFDGLSDKQRKGALGDRYRALVAPQHACWQQNGHDAYLDVEDAVACLGPCRYRAAKSIGRQHYKFRVVQRTVSRATKVVI